MLHKPQVRVSIVFFPFLFYPLLLDILFIYFSCQILVKIISCHGYTWVVKEAFCTLLSIQSNDFLNLQKDSLFYTTKDSKGSVRSTALQWTLLPLLPCSNWTSLVSPWHYAILCLVYQPIVFLIIPVIFSTCSPKSVANRTAIKPGIPTDAGP